MRPGIGTRRATAAGCTRTRADPLSSFDGTTAPNGVTHRPTSAKNVDLTWPTLTAAKPASVIVDIRLDIASPVRTAPIDGRAGVPLPSRPPRVNGRPRMTGTLAG